MKKILLLVFVVLSVLMCSEKKEEVKKETVIKEENKSKEENVSKKESETENKEKNVNEEKKLEKPTISEQRISLEELRNQIMNLEIEQGYDEDKKYVKAK